MLLNSESFQTFLSVFVHTITIFINIVISRHAARGIFSQNKVNMLTALSLFGVTTPVKGSQQHYSIVSHVWDRHNNIVYA